MTWMGLGSVILSELRQRQNHMISLVCIIITPAINEPIYRKIIRVTDVENKLMFTSGETGEGRDKLGD